MFTARQHVFLDPTDPPTPIDDAEFCDTPVGPFATRVVHRVTLARKRERLCLMCGACSTRADAA